MSESMMKEPISRRTFLKLAAGSAAGALLFHFPFQASAAEETAKTLEIRPCALSALPAAEESAKNSPLVKGSFIRHYRNLFIFIEQNGISCLENTGFI